MTSVVMGYEDTFLAFRLGNSRCLNVVSGIHRRMTFNPTYFIGSPISIVEPAEAEAEELELEVARMTDAPMLWRALVARMI